MTRKEYIQKWRAWAHKHAPLTTDIIWDFQKSILSPGEQKLSEEFCLYLDKDDPRHDVLDLSDRAWHKAIDEKMSAENER